MVSDLKRPLPWIHRLASTLTSQQATALADLLARTEEATWQQRRYVLFYRIAHAEAQRPLQGLLDEWEQMADPPAAPFVAALARGVHCTSASRRLSPAASALPTTPSPPSVRP